VTSTNSVDRTGKKNDIAGRHLVAIWREVGTYFHFAIP
jgi:hypothetical protein